MTSNYITFFCLQTFLNQLVDMAFHDWNFYRLCLKVNYCKIILFMIVYENYIYMFLIINFNNFKFLSVKWIGLFTTALVGLYTIEDLWNKLGDLYISKV